MSKITLENATHANHYGFSDIEPYEIIRKISAKTIEVRRMDAVLLNGEELEFHPGGFAAHCSNQSVQRYEYSSNVDNYTVRIRLRKDGRWYDSSGAKFLLDEHPRKFYDYNF